jgi:predicted Fe-S protein YdhL (DUF1289 family)
MSVASPCVNICRMDADNAICVGCFRTLDEIAQWSRASDNTKLAILAAVEKRRAEHDPTGSDFRGECERI